MAIETGSINVDPLLGLRGAAEPCVWKRDEVSDRAWFVPPHEGEDDESPAIQHVWSFCPYCGKPLAFETQGDPK
jgi:hypothetical protein